jgi:hypothetical protein
MRLNRTLVGFTALGLALLSGVFSASAQGPNLNLNLAPGSGTFGVRTMTFESWCQDTQHYAPPRCDARRPEDVKAFEDYRSAIERYELDYLKRVQQDRDLRARTNRDPSQTVKGFQDSVP